MAASKTTTGQIRWYLKKIKKEFEAGDATEHTHRSALKELIEEFDEDIIDQGVEFRDNLNLPFEIIKY